MDIMRAASPEYDELALRRLSFFDQENPSILCFDDNFNSYEDNIPHSRHNGPSRKEFIAALEKAGDDWRKLSFVPPARRLTLVPKP